LPFEKEEHMKSSPKTLLAALVLVFAAPAFGHERVADKCGCHSQFGLRHCHPKKKTRTCEAPVNGKVAGPVQKAKPAPAQEHAQTSL
jgi:hypothetical protein